MEKLTYKDIIEDTVKYYSEDPSRRSLLSGNKYTFCAYYNPENGNMCAAGRYMKQPDKFDGESFCSLMENFKFKDIMKEEVHHLDNEDFWESLQALHDAHLFWDESGLTIEGETHYNSLLEIKW